ncbi:MAG: Ldh family oxidoreductase [bacterium]|nr:MAG: Ldh family oxidoreductase [bacterium]
MTISAPVNNKHPFVLDISTTVASMGKVTRAADLKQKLPETWALDVDGFPTTDPSKAILGSLLPIGNYKGFGLAISIEIITALLSGGPSAPHINSWIRQTHKSMGVSFTMIAIDISRFQKLDFFKRRMQEWIEIIINSPKKKGVERIYYSGEIEGETYDARKISGIPVDNQTIELFKSLADRYKISHPTFKDNKS